MEKDRVFCLASKKIEIRHFYFACKTLKTLCIRRAHRESESAKVRRIDQSGINQDARLVISRTLLKQESEMTNE